MVDVGDVTGLITLRYCEPWDSIDEKPDVEYCYDDFCNAGDNKRPQWMLLIGLVTITLAILMGEM